MNVPGVPVPRADCGPGSQPETPGSLQGEVTNADRDNGRAFKPYTCNLQLVGNDPGQGASWQNAWYGDCDYYDTSLPSQLGVQVVDVADPAKPKTIGALTSPAMLDPWESLSVADNRPDGRPLLAGVYVSDLQGAAFLDVYDVEDCKKPQQVFSGPVSGLNHEGNWAMDGMTYYASGLSPGTLTAVDMADPSVPRPITTFLGAQVGHGLSTSDDGNRLYYAAITTSDGSGNGLTIIDTSQIQARAPAPQAPIVSNVTWTDGSTAQHTLPITIKGHPYVLFADEGGFGAARLIDIADERNPKVVSELKLEIHIERNQDRAAESAAGSFGYDAHYCGVDRRVETTIVVCSMFNSGLRVFDVRDPLAPREIAYYNPGGTGQPSPPGSQYSFPNQTSGPQTTTSGFPSARPRVIPERGEIWFTDQNKGFHVVRFANGVWPFKAAGPTESRVGLPARTKCLTKSKVRFRLKKKLRRARTAVVYVNGRRVKRLRGKALRRKVSVKLPRGHSIVRVVVKTRKGKRLAQTKDYTRCARR
jgi:hypothetical protein